ncbi:hypothetical protein KPL76_04015 [Subtercola sp. PAMC28395]|uniref:Ig-like domain-containing protein n=1 Tax=Subtercola sp. PAMC28395 TaxID=2846775 RepID=UPI001C0DA518|nr:Ig-like domain-containing protein [Subtercola sp. PAMC28395]QWT24563.1 hypothetical protein KPL76_04015 [Subtercola sp. PAMC28395]
MGATSASASDHKGGFKVHQPLACKRGDAGGLRPEDGCDYHPFGGGKTGGVTFGWDATYYADNRDFSSFNPLSAPRMFPQSSSGFNCITADNGSMVCDRSSAGAPNTGKVGATVNQLGLYSYRGDVISWTEDDTADCGGYTGGLCFVATFNFPHYVATAYYRYDAGTGLVREPSVLWAKSDGTYIGQSKHFLTGSDPEADLQPAGAMNAISFVSPGRSLTALPAGSDVTYGVTLTATQSGSAVVTLNTQGVKDLTEAVVPDSWVRIGTGNPTVVKYLVPYMNAGEIKSLSLHFTATGTENVAIDADVNSQSKTHAAVDLRPDAPACDVPATGAVVPVGGEQTTLYDVNCHVPAGTHLETRPHSDTHGVITIVGGASLVFKADDPKFTGKARTAVWAVNDNGQSAEPTFIDINVIPPATALADTFTVTAGQTLTLDAAHGVVANDQFAAGPDGWYVEAGNPPANGSLDIRADGSLTYTPKAGFTGDDTFRYRLGGRNGSHSGVVTVTMHVTP